MKSFDYKELSRKLVNIGLELSKEKNITLLMQKILDQSIEITNADSGSIYFIEKHDDIEKLVFKYTQSKTIDFPFKEFKMNIDMSSIAGCCVLTKQALSFKTMDEVETKLGFKHNKSFDNSIGYSTHNMLTIPLKSYNDKVIGVIQLINKYDDFDNKVISLEGFSEFEEEVILSLASQTAILIERSLLFDNIQRLLDSFIETLVSAIEKRDPVTSGHSKRVAKYALEFANYLKINSKLNDKISDEDIKEIYTAGMLHDVGKIAVREKFLNKKNRLEDYEIDLIKYRYLSIQKTLELRKMEDKLSVEDNNILNNIELFFTRVSKISNLGYLNAEDKAFIDELLSTQISKSNLVLLTNHEYRNLSIQRGNLTNEEREEINKHAVYTKEILDGIDWTDDLLNVSKYASTHHEKLDGSGYPYALKEDKLDLPTRILSIIDIYDALTAEDRPYKPPLSIEKTLQILEEDAQRGALDKYLVSEFKKMKLAKRKGSE